MKETIYRQFYYKKNPIQQLRGFYYTVRLGSPSKAALKMGISQSAVSLQLKTLERDHNTILFKRSKNNFTLTNKGKILYELTVKYVHGIESIYDEFVKKCNEQEDSIIKIAANHVGVSYILPKLVKEFNKILPNSRIIISNLTKVEGLKRLINNQIDLFIYPMEKIPVEFNFIPIVKYQPILLLSKNHELAKKKNLKLSDIQKYNLLRIDPELITLPAFEEIILSHGIKSFIDFENSDWEILKKYVRAGLGVAIISNICLGDNADQDLVGIKLLEYFPEMNYGVLIKKEILIKNSLQKFLKLIESNP